MMIATRLDWNTANKVHAAELSEDGSKVLFVSDGQVGYSAETPTEMKVSSALEDFARDYVTDNPGSTVEVSWSLWENGEEIKAGFWEFEAAK